MNKYSVNYKKIKIIAKKYLSEYIK